MESRFPACYYPVITPGSGPGASARRERGRGRQRLLSPPIIHPREEKSMITSENLFGVAVERIFPLHSPKIAKIEVVSRGAVRRAKLYYIRDKVGRKARVKKAK